MSRTGSFALGDALEAFIREHEYCGEVDTGVENDRVWMTCTCGAMSYRRAAGYVDISKHVGRVNDESILVDEIAA